MSNILFHPSSPLYDAALQLTQAQLAQTRVHTSNRLVRESIECIDGCLALICKQGESGPELFVALNERGADPSRPEALTVRPHGHAPFSATLVGSSNIIPARRRCPCHDGR